MFTVGVFSPVFMNRNAQSLSLLHTDEDVSTDVLYSYVRTHTHSTIYVFHSNEMLSKVPILRPLATGGEWISIYVKQSSTQSNHSENYSNKDVINGTVSLFQSNLWI